MTEGVHGIEHCPTKCAASSTRALKGASTFQWQPARRSSDFVSPATLPSPWTPRPTTADPQHGLLISACGYAMVHYEEGLSHKRSLQADGYWPWKTGDEEVSVSIPDSELGSRQAPTFSWPGLFLSLLALGLVCLALFLGRDYIKYVLLWLEEQNQLIVLSLFVLLFCIVSFPFMWGYILLNVACGYVYGLFLGLLVVVVAVLLGTALAHVLMKRFLAHHVASKLAQNGALAATLNVLGGPQTFRVIAVTRLTPIPFGLQNAVFAISPIGTVQYLLASVVGLFPTQAINAYLGSTLRSMEDVLSDANTATTGYIIFAVQVVISICLMAYVVQKAREMLHNVIYEESENSSSWQSNSCVNSSSAISMVDEISEESPGYAA